MLSKDREVPPQIRDWGLSPEGALGILFPAMLAPTNACTPVTSSSPPPPPLQASFHCILRGLRVIFGGVLEEGTYPLARRLLQGRMIGEIVQFQAPNEVFWAVSLPVDPAEQLVPWSYRCALSQRKGHILPVAQFLAGLPQFSDLPTLQVYFDSFHP